MDETSVVATETGIVEKTINTIRGLSMDAVQAAKSGHPGLPMGAAPMGYALFADHLRFDPQAPKWHNRDRFILSAGHGSMLLYSLLHLTGYDLSLDDLKQFRQWGSKTPGHPENFMTPGVEMATGPLGQGFATGVGMAIAEERARALYPEHFDHWAYAIVSDGDLMEGLSHEAASLAGHLRLGRMIYLYDSNRITIDGSTDLSFSEDVRKRFEAYGWHTEVCDGMSVGEVSQAIASAKADPRPSLIICRTTIGYGSPHKAGTAASHGAPLGEDEVRLSKQILGIPLEPLFLVPDDVREHMAAVGARSRDDRVRSEKAFSGSDAETAIQAAPDWAAIPDFDKPAATRASSGKVINALAPSMPMLVGGSADLSESNQTEIHGSTAFSSSDRTGRNLHFGVREHAMAAALNGITLHATGRAFGGTFLIFSDYMKPSVRLAALMQIGTIFVYTHDSIGLGEDGPTHQPIEHLAGLRAIPNLHVFRPADGNETAAAWKSALARTDGPTAIVLTRQSVRQLTPRGDSALKGAYVLRDCENPQVVLIGTGSEVEICVDAAELLSGEVRARVVSMPCWEAFAAQTVEYRNKVLPVGVPCVSVEAAATLGWERWVGQTGKAIGLDHFGASAPYQEIYEQFGLTAKRVADECRALV